MESGRGWFPWPRRYHLTHLVRTGEIHKDISCLRCVSRASLSRPVFPLSTVPWYYPNTRRYSFWLWNLNIKIAGSKQIDLSLLKVAFSSYFLQVLDNLYKCSTMSNEWIECVKWRNTLFLHYTLGKSFHGTGKSLHWGSLY